MTPPRGGADSCFKCPLMGKIVLLEVSFLGGGRIATKNLIAVRMTAESRDHLFHVAGLLHQRPVNRLQVRGGFCGDLYAKPDEEIEALKVIGSLAMAEWQTMNDLEPWRWQRRSGRWMGRQPTARDPGGATRGAAGIRGLRRERGHPPMPLASSLGSGSRPNTRRSSRLSTRSCPACSPPSGSIRLPLRTVRRRRGSGSPRCPAGLRIWSRD